MGKRHPWEITLREFVEKVRSAWSEAGRDGEPRIMALCYFALGPNARETADHDLHLLVRR